MCERCLVAQTYSTCVASSLNVKNSKLSLCMTVKMCLLKILALLAQRRQQTVFLEDPYGCCAKSVKQEYRSGVDNRNGFNEFDVIRMLRMVRRGKGNSQPSGLRWGVNLLY